MWLPEHDRITGKRDALLAFIRSRGVAEEDAEDILQDSLLSAIQKAPELRDEEKLTAWLFQIVRNAIADHFRRLGKHVESLDGGEPVTPISEEEHRMICACMNALIPTLAPAYAEVIEAVELEGESHASAAARLGITRENLRVRLHRARRQLKDRLEETCQVIVGPWLAMALK